MFWSKWLIVWSHPNIASNHAKCYFHALNMTSHMGTFTRSWILIKTQQMLDVTAWDKHDWPLRCWLKVWIRASSHDRSFSSNAWLHCCQMLEASHLEPDSNSQSTSKRSIMLVSSSYFNHLSCFGQNDWWCENTSRDKLAWLNKLSHTYDQKDWSYEGKLRAIHKRRVYYKIQSHLKAGLPIIPTSIQMLIRHLLY